MWDRIKFKSAGKAAFKKNYWPCVAVCILMAIAMGAFRLDLDLDESFDAKNIVSTALGVLGFGGSLVSIALSIVVFNPYAVGARRFTMENRVTEKAKFSIVGYGFSKNFGNIVLVQFMKNLFIFLWSLLFIIPGIIKTLAYFAVPFILAENPDMPYKRALQLSKDMTMGHKGDLFVMGLSFIGWTILTALTAGIVGAFHYFPYLYATEAEAYAFLREEALMKGITTIDELPGYGEPQAQEPTFDAE